MEAMKKIINKFLSITSGSILVIMVILTLWQVLCRYVLKNPSTVTEEFVRLLLVWLTCLAGAYGFGLKSHLVLDIVVENLSKPVQRICSIFVHSLLLILAVSVFVYGGLEQTIETIGQVTPALQMSVSFQYFAVPVGGACMVFYEIYALRELLLTKKGL